MNIAETVDGAEELVEAVVSLGGSRRKRADLSLELSGDRGADAKKFMDDFVISVNKAQGAIATARGVWTLRSALRERSPLHSRR